MKSPKMEELFDKISVDLFGVSRTEMKCPFCKSTKVQPEDFRDDFSRKEFEISHLCQQCQDDTFEEE